MSEYNTNQDGQWKTSEQWRAEEANDHFNPKKNKNGGRGKYVAKLAASAVAFGLIAGLVMQGVTYGFSRAGIGNGATQLATTKTTSSSSSTRTPIRPSTSSRRPDRPRSGQAICTSAVSAAGRMRTIRIWSSGTAPNALGIGATVWIISTIMCM